MKEGSSAMIVQTFVTVPEIEPRDGHFVIWLTLVRCYFARPESILEHAWVAAEVQEGPWLEA